MNDVIVQIWFEQLSRKKYLDLSHMVDLDLGLWTKCQRWG